jgi:hypothetical protein
LLAKGPPVYIEDKHALALDDEDPYIVKPWYASDGQERSAKLMGSVDGKERDELLESLKSFVIAKGKEEGDDDD